MGGLCVGARALAVGAAPVAVAARAGVAVRAAERVGAGALGVGAAGVGVAPAFMLGVAAVGGESVGVGAAVNEGGGDVVAVAAAPVALPAGLAVAAREGLLEALPAALAVGAGGEGLPEALAPPAAASEALAAPEGLPVLLPPPPPPHPTSEALTVALELPVPPAAEPVVLGEAVCEGASGEAVALGEKVPAPKVRVAASGLADPEPLRLGEEEGERDVAGVEEGRGEGV